MGDKVDEIYNEILEKVSIINLSIIELDILSKR